MFPVYLRIFRAPFIKFGFQLLRLFLFLSVPESRNNIYKNRIRKYADSKYDFIVVGSGSSGSVVGSRLAENKDWKVLILEAGDFPGPETYVPVLHTLLLDTKHDWHYKTVPQKHAMKGYVNQSNRYPRGKVLGGSSSINFMMYVRGNRKDFDNWAAMGNEGWDYESVLPYFKKSEDYKGVLNDDNYRYHSTGGPMRVQSKHFFTPSLMSYLEAGQEMGFRTNYDPNGRTQTGFSIPDLTVRDGLRESVAEAFLKPKLGLQNLHVLPNAFVLKVLLDKHKRAIGVKYIYRNKIQTVYARKEVIMSAGAVDSPKILMLSGIGPKKHLEDFNIPVLVNLPGVGQNFHDHPVIFGLTWTVNTGEAYSLLRTFSNSSAFRDYRSNRGGPFASPMGVEGNIFAQVSGGDPMYPDLEVLMMSISPASDSGLLLSDIIGYKPELYGKYFQSLFKKDTFALGPTLLRPKSRGSITLRSRNPLDPANIDPNFLEHPDDIEFFVRAIKFCLRFGETNAMKKIGAKFHDMPLPGCDHLSYGSDEYWRCYTRHVASTVYHPAGSCKMTPSSDPMGVVDNRLRVRGVSGLRVIDASIMPLVTSGNTNAPCIMIGEKGADMIKEDHWRKNLSRNFE